ncbi:hypothetical protein [Streptomyces silvisoli]|uniref:Uncharacterized protein n=1 Tax=Streptomyces silvisoli TaxID=3034235 RepID=A0ABT5ZWW2_9ACTN|nr:hypothetical protein [Streptomyces silvisoli]MDF3294322.1 hypothetical protein [Streptomyces silvisoli]
MATHRDPAHGSEGAAYLVEQVEAQLDLLDHLAVELPYRDLALQEASDA